MGSKHFPVNSITFIPFNSRILDGAVLVLMIVGGALMFNMVFEDPEAFQEMSEGLEESIAFSIISTVGGIGLQIFGIYLIYKWSEEWNKQFSKTEN